MNSLTNLMILLLFFFYSQVSIANQYEFQLDFSGSSIEQNEITIMGPGFGTTPIADIEFGQIPKDQSGYEKTDGFGAIVKAAPTKGIMLLTKQVTTSSAALIRCSIRSNNPNVNVTLAAIGNGNQSFLSTNGPSNGDLFYNQYQKVSLLVVPPSEGFQPLLQIVNTSPSKAIEIYIDNFEVYQLDSESYYDSGFINDENIEPKFFSYEELENINETLEFIYNTPYQLDFSESNLDNGQIIFQGAGFGSLPEAKVSFDNIPKDNLSSNATDGYGIKINAGPQEGIMILDDAFKTSNVSLVRCHVRSNSLNVAVTLASIDQSSNTFVSTNAPISSELFYQKYERLSLFVIPCTTGFQPLLQVVNTSEEDDAIIYVDNLEIYEILPDTYYSGAILDGDFIDPEIVGIKHNEKDTTPSPTIAIPKSPTPTPTATFEIEEEIVTFDGGDLDDLKQLSPSLSFDHLIINGVLDLPLVSSIILSVNHLTITSNGFIKTSWGDCEYENEPTLSIIASGNVILDGDIQLNGRPGAFVSNNYWCKSCYGNNGGKILITANQIICRNSISADGGSGGVDDTGYGSSGCSGGDGGLVEFEANIIEITDAKILVSGAKGGTGYYDTGEENRGYVGNPGSIKFISDNLIKINNSTINTNGNLTLHAMETSIYNNLDAELIVDSIAGSEDNVAPMVEIVVPQNNAEIDLNEPFLLSLNTFDTGTGISSIKIEGMGINFEASLNGFENGIKEFTLPSPLPIGNSITVTVDDNKGLSTSKTVSGLTLYGDRIIESGDTLKLTSSLDFQNSSLNVAGTIVISRLFNSYTLSCASFTLQEEAKIIIEGEEPKDSPSLTIHANKQIDLSGIIDLSGSKGGGLKGGRENLNGHRGGNISLKAPKINIDSTGILKSNGGVGNWVEAGLLIYYGGDGGNGGDVSFNASTIDIQGRIEANGGDASIINCGKGGNGGDILISYELVSSFEGRIESVGGKPSKESCKEYGLIGNILGTYLGPIPTEYTMLGNEIEPNNIPSQEQILFPPFDVSGNVTQDDVGFYSLTEDGIKDDCEDLYRISTNEPLEITLMLQYDSTNADLDMYLIDFNDITFWTNLSRTPGNESMYFKDLPPGEYLIGISSWEGRPVQESIDYTIFAYPGRF